MIPGPVSGHAPIDPGAAQRQPADAASDSGPEAGTSFADLLAAMLSPGAPGARLQVEAADEAVFERLDAAKMFNETGLFRGAAPLPSHGAIPGEVSPAAASPSPAVTSDLGPQADLQALSPALDAAAAVPGFAVKAAGLAEGGGTPVSRGPAGAASKSPHAALPSLDGQPVAIAADPAPSAAAGPEAAGGGRVSSRTSAMVAQLLAAKAGAAAAQVSVQAVEGGINVMARVDRLSREERDRLRGEIGELLARHGFANAEIVLNGEAWPLPQREED
jgi:hypothetical protein